MDKVIVKTASPEIMALQRQTMKAGYEALTDVSMEDIPVLCAESADVHGLLIDRAMITPEQIRQLRARLRSALFPIILFSEPMTPEETDQWITAGATEILTMPISAALMGRRIDNVIRLYCISRSLSDQEHDRLTGLYNRYAFYHFAQEMIANDPCAEYTIILSDIEDFRLINQRFGEEKGDELLAYVGRALGAISGEAMLFARYSGDQFVGIIKRVVPESDADEAPLTNGMDMLYANAPLAHFKVKFGLYDNVDKSLPISIMCDRAAMALRTVKHQYNQTLAKYSPQMQQQFNREQRIIDSMEEALAQEQFQVYYQPKHDVQSSRIVGVEALVRWIHPSYGFMSPGEFIPLFERNGFISQLDKYVWRHVCRDVKEWLAHGLPVVPVSVNASRRDLLQEGYLQAVQAPLKEYGVDPRYFHMEITESIFMEDAEILAPVIEQLRS